MLRVFLCLALAVGCLGYASYRDQIPNGMNVPHPCKDNSIWSAVGHKDPRGKGPINPFGVDLGNSTQGVSAVQAKIGVALNATPLPRWTLKSGGRVWTVDLCQMDSDGDGKTNGEELGDPDCVWTTGTPPARTSGISHPGICDPWDSEKCAEINSWLPCDSSIFKCDATSDPDVKNFTLRFPPTKVPAQRINYYCMAFRMQDHLDMSQDYHLVANRPLINNSNVIRAITLFGCGDEDIC